MRPFALFYVWECSIYFLLFSELTPTEEASLPPPFQLGPFLFGKNRVSLLTFGPRELRIEKLGACFRLRQGTDVIELNAKRPAAFYNLASHKFETASQARRPQIALLTKLSFENLYNVDPDMMWITKSDTRYNILYSCNAESSQVADSIFGQILKDCSPFLPSLLDNDPQNRPDRGDFPNVVTRARIIFGVLAHYAVREELFSHDGDVLLPVTTTGRPESDRVSPRPLHLPWIPAVAHLPSIVSHQSGTPSPGPSTLSSSPADSATYDIVLTPMPRAQPTPPPPSSPLIFKFASLGPRETESVEEVDTTILPWQVPMADLQRKVLGVSPTQLSVASTTEGSAQIQITADEYFM